jgi:aryl-alcohol dehydrogenase-like predicted oxidoreductase
MRSGLLTGKMTPERIQNMPSDDWRRGADDFQEPKLSRNLELVEKLREIGSATAYLPPRSRSLGRCAIQGSRRR